MKVKSIFTFLFILSAVSIFAKLTSKKEYVAWYRNDHGGVDSVHNYYQCYTGNSGCLGRTGAAIGQQLYADPDLLDPLRP